MFRILRRVVLFGFLGGAFLLLILLLVLRAGADARLINSVLRSVIPGATTSVADVSGNYFSRLKLLDIRIVRQDGVVLLRCDTASIGYELLPLLSGKVVINRVALGGPRLVLAESPEGSWNPMPPSGPKPPSAKSKSFPAITVEQFSIIRGSAEFRSPRSEQPLEVRFNAAGALVDRRLTVDRFQLESDSSAVLAKGAITFPRPGERLNLHELSVNLGAQPLAVRDVRTFVSQPDLNGTVRLQGRLEGDGNHSTVTLETSIRNLRGGPISRLSPQPVDGLIAVNFSGQRLSDMTGHARVELSNQKRRVTAQVQLAGGQAQLELRGNLGVALAQMSGWIRPFDSLPSYDLQGQSRPVKKVTPPKGDKWLNPWNRTIAVRAQGRGLPPHHAVGRATVRVGPVRAGATLLDSGVVDLRLNGAVALFAAKAGLSRGMVEAHGKARWGSGAELWIQRGSIANLDLAAILGDSAWQRIQGNFSLNVASKNGGLRFSTRSHLNDADLELRAVSRSKGSERSLTIRQLAFDHLDFSRFRSHEPVSDLNGDLRLHAAGRSLRTAVATVSVRLNPSRLDRFDLERLILEAGLKGGAARAQGQVATPAGQLSFAGGVRPFDSVPSYDLRQLDFSDLDLGRLLQKKDLSTRLTGSFTSEGRGKTLRDAELKGTLELRQSLAGRARISHGRVEANLKGGEVDLVGSLHGEHDSLLIGAAVSPFEEHPPVKLVTRLPFAEIAAFLQPDSVPDAEGAAYLALSGTLGRPDSMRLQAELEADGRLGDVKLDSLKARLRLRDGVVEVDSLALESNVGVATAAGVMGLFGAAQSAPAGLRLRARLDSLAPLVPFIGTDLGLDSGRIDLTAGGSRNRLRLTLSLAANGLTRGTQKLDQLTATVAARLEKNHPSSGMARVTARGIRTRKTSVQSIEVRGSSAGGELAVRGDAVIDSRNNLRGVARLRRERQGLRVELDSLNVVTSKRPWALRHPVDMLFGDSIRIDDFVLASGAHHLAVNGVIDRKGEQDFQVDIDSLRIQPIAHLLGAGQLDGELNAMAHLKGPAASPDLQAEWDVAVRSRDRDLGRVRGRAAWTTDGLRIDGTVAPPESDSLTVKGRLPLSLTLSSSDSGSGLIARIPGGELVLDAVGDNVDISKFQPLFNPEKLQVGGRLALNAHARGSFEALRLAGDVVMRKAEFRIRPLAKYHDGLLRLALEGEEARIVEGHFQSGEGEATLGGKIGFDRFPQLTLDIGAKLQNFAALADDQLRAGATGDVHLGGNVKNPRLSIAARLQNTDYYLKAKNLQTSAEAVELSPEDLRILEERFGPEVVAQSKKVKGLLPPWGLDWKLTLGDNVWLRRRSDPVMAVELTGNLEVRKEPNQVLQAFGKIEPVVGRSFVQLMSRRFDLKSGDVTLNGPLKQARVGLEAEYRTTEAGGSTPILIIATVKSDTGLVVQLDSRPVMREADIMSYLTTGRPASTDPTLQSDEQDVLAAGAGLAVGAALGSVAGKAGQSLGLDVVQVLQDREGGQTVVAGKYVSAPLYLGFRQPIVPASSNSRSSSTQQNAVELEMEYAALRDILVNLQAGGSEMRVFLKLRR